MDMNEKTNDSMLRGGSWYNSYVRGTQSTYRGMDDPKNRDDVIGFRCVFKKGDKDE